MSTNLQDRPSRLDDEWDRHRPAVFGVAYRVTGSVADAEDIVQDVWLRAAAQESLDDVRDLRAWLVTVAARRAYDVLGTARARRVDYVGPWLPEPLLTGPDIADKVLVDDTVGTAMMLVLEELSPPERVAFVLRRAFDVPYEQIAEVLGKSPAACRQLASRAGRKVAAARPARPPSRTERERVLTAFRAAYEKGDATALMELLDPDATYTTDGGGKVFAARKIIRGAARVAAILLRVGRQKSVRFTPAEVNGEPALLVLGAIGPGGPGGHRVRAIDTVEIENGRITAYRRVINPDKLPTLHVRSR
ncbi:MULTISPECIES: RNA polymerase sigma factor SigJ [Actinomadura]|uniref:Sigma-70 family RNA polymerase sigma factor n=1 Tax=Actinomadura litoris TaxID=2678616 RepID=A0A7K1L702_9ACTN|nr:MULTISPECIES: RNA polymerase sigma factor SigJ [Actinomadura]MBT2209497.1 RNA polymerase sigma factor SigJ [Actinomadura sp. NEAU-AAG7]MUN40188.1 sigma-70 family RNA polymerase sigma factor [Actinomadura litoris]